MSTILNNWLGAVRDSTGFDATLGPTTSDAELGAQIARMPAFARQIANLEAIAAQFDLPNQPANPDVVALYDACAQARSALREMDTIAREGLAAAIRAGRIRMREDETYELAALPVVLAVVAAIGTVIAQFMIRRALWVVAATAITAALALGTSLALKLTRPITAVGTAARNVGEGFKAATMPIAILGALWLFSQLKRKRGGA